MKGTALLLALLVSASPAAAQNPAGRGYNIIPASVVLTLLYLGTLELVRRKSMSLATQRRIWNVVLLATFTASTGLGVVLLLSINYGVVVPLPFRTMYWHVEAGIAMAVVSVFHVIWHLPYFRAIAAGRNR